MQRIYQSFERQTMMQTLGVQLGEVRAGYVEIMAPILPGSLQQHGYAHAALIFAIGDSAAGYAALSVMGEEFEVLTFFKWLLKPSAQTAVRKVSD